MTDELIETGTPILADELVPALDCLLLTGDDFDIWLEQRDFGPALTLSADDETDTVASYRSGGWQTSADGEESGPQPLEFPAFLCPRAFRGAVAEPNSSIPVPTDDEEFEGRVLDLHFPYLQLVTTFIATGWYVTVRYESPTSFDDFGSISVRAKAPQTARSQSRVVQDALGPTPAIVTAAVRWCERGPDSWDFDPLETGLLVRDEVWPRDALLLEDYAIAIAPTWTLAPGIDEPLGDLPDAGPVRPAIALSPPTPPSTEELNRRQRRVSEWALEHGFLKEVRPAIAKEVRTLLDSAGLGKAGYYLLEFANGECYVGQSTCIDKRLAQHLLNHPDTISIRIRLDPEALAATEGTLRHLLRRERDLIHSAQRAELHARNKSEMTVITGDSSLDCLIGAAEQAEWLRKPADKNRSDVDTGRVLDSMSGNFVGSDRNFANFCNVAGDQSPRTLGLVGKYLRGCVPYPNATEGQFWNISAPLSAYRGGRSRSRTLSCLTVGWVETLVLLARVDTGEIHGFLQVNGTELYGDRDPDVAFIQLKRRHPGITIEPATYRDSGPDNWNLFFSNLEALARLLSDPKVTQAAATTVLLLMRVRRAPSPRRQTHCPWLVEASWQQLPEDFSPN